MKKNFVIIIFSISLVVSNMLFANNNVLKGVVKPKLSTIDTLYYLADTARVPRNDRIFRVENSYMAKDFYIYCSCLNTEQGCIYLTGAERRSFIIIKKKFKLLRLTPLADLISIIKTYNTRDFGGQHIIYIVVPTDKETYTLYPAINRSNGIIQRMQ